MLNKDNIYPAYIWNFDCPVHGEIFPVPFYIWGSKCFVPQKCIFCPYLFEGECTWRRDHEMRPFSLQITQAVEFGKDEAALHRAFNTAVDQFVLSPVALRFLLVIDGNFSMLTVDVFQHILDEFNSIFSEYLEKSLFSVFLDTFEGIRVSLVQEFLLEKPKLNDY